MGLKNRYFAIIPINIINTALLTVCQRYRHQPDIIMSERNYGKSEKNNFVSHRELSFWPNIVFNVNPVKGGSKMTLYLLNSSHL